MNPLVSTEWLEAELGSPGLRVVDATVRILVRPDGRIDGQSAFAEYEREHIPGAQFVDLARDVSDISSGLRFMVPPPEQFVAAMQNLGIGNDCRVVVYSSTELFWATRFWWLLRLFGHENVAVLGGGLAKWRAEGRQLSNQIDPVEPVNFECNPDYSKIARKEDILDIAEDPDCKTPLVDVLSADHYRGETKSAYGYAPPGHIQGAINVPTATLIDNATGSLLPEEELLNALGPAVSNNGSPIFYCGGGIAATQGAFAMAVLGKEARVYDASLQEWASDIDLPMIIGPDPR